MLTVAWCALATCVLVRADYVAATVTTGLGLRQVAVNPVTNKIYTANYGSSSVTLIDGATNATLTVGVGANPYLLAVNPVTNNIYVVNLSDSVTESSFVTVIDGATNASSTVGVGVDPQAIGVNTVTNKIYVAIYESNTVTVIDGATNSTTTVNVGTQLIALAVNEVTNKIYTANYGSNSVTAIDGANQRYLRGHLQRVLYRRRSACACDLLERRFVIRYEYLVGERARSRRELDWAHEGRKQGGLLLRS
jgi:YVTN family beta-propeller protein